MMKRCFIRRAVVVAILGLWSVLTVAGHAQDIPKGQTQKSLPSTRVTIEVTGGEKDVPIETPVCI